jgi:two-component system cell cycle sensor histidine kinase/response regulator CckA
MTSITSATGATGRKAAAPVQMTYIAAAIALLLLGLYLGSSIGSHLYWFSGLATLVFASAIAAATLAKYRVRLNPVAGFESMFGTIDQPAMLTSRAGEIIVMNAAAMAQFDAPASIEEMLEPLTSDAAALVYQMGQAVKQRGYISHEIVSAGGGFRLVAQAMQGGRIVWRLVRNLEGDAENLSDMAARLPQIHFDEDGAILKMNDAAHRLVDAPLTTIESLIEDLPLRPGGIHRLAGPRGGQVRLHLMPERDRSQIAILLPCDPSEKSGVRPESVLDDLPVALARLAPDGTLIYANAAARSLLGERAVEGAQIARLIEGLGRSIPERLMDTARGRAQGRSEVARGKIDDREIFLQVTLTRVMMDGEVSLLAVLADATELKTLEAQFVQSQKMQAVGQLAGGVAHDFNNLLTAIHGHCDLLLMRHDQGDPDFADLTQIRQNANRAAALVSQLLAFSRKQTLRPTTLQLGDTLSELAHLLNRLLGAKVTLDIDCAPDLWFVRVDERQFEQVIVNLAVNARDAMPMGGAVKVRATNLRLDTEMRRDRAAVPIGDYVRIEVADTGIGIPPDKIGKIFEPFYTTKRLGEGTGLGLSTVYGIVKQTGGFVFAESEPGKGTTFTLYLPANEPQEEAAPEPVLPVPVKAPRSLSGRGVILLVEDEAPVRSIAARALNLCGYTVLEADSGEAALRLLEDPKVKVDLFLSDVIMPGLDGPSWVEEARRRGAEAPTIFVSGYAEDAFGEGRSVLDPSAFLPKPFSINELTEKVKTALEASA